MGNPSQGNAIQCQFSGSVRGQLCCDPRAPLRYLQKLLCPQRGPANWVMLLENKTDTPSTGRLHARQEPGPSQFALQRVIWCLLRILGCWPWGPLSDVCRMRSIGCLIALFCKKRSHQATKSAMGMLSASRGFSIAACSGILSHMQPLGRNAGMFRRVPCRQLCAL